jgi:peptidylprolyl isomerase
MRDAVRSGFLCGFLLVLVGGCASEPPAPRLPPRPTSAQVLEATTPDDWRALDPENTLYLELAAGRVILELAPAFAPNHVANIKTLARERYFDGIFIIRVQDNYVAQWGDPEEDPARKRKLKGAKAALPPEFARSSDDLPFTKLPDGDVYAAEVGHSAGFPAARDPATSQAWLTHCYGMLGVGRGNTADSGGGAELYVVIGHAPRHLDRNITLAGRVVKGIDLLSALPRGTGPLGFYEKRQQYIPIRSIRVAADVAESDRTPLELLRTDTAAWTAWVESRRNRREDWFIEPVGHVEVCNVPLPARPRAVK